MNVYSISYYAVKEHHIKFQTIKIDRIYYRKTNQEKIPSNQTMPIRQNIQVHSHTKKSKTWAGKY